MEDMKYIPPKHLKERPKAPVKPEKVPKQSTADKAFIKALHGHTRKFTMPLREAYAQLHKDEIADRLTKAWEEEKKKIKASDENCKHLVGTERNKYLSKLYPKFRAKYLLELLDHASEEEIAQCEQLRFQKSEEVNEKETDINV